MEFTPFESDENPYLDKYVLDKLYIGNPTKQGKYVTLVTDSDTLFELNVSKKVKLAIQAFHVDSKDDIGTYKLVKIINGKETGSITLSSFDLQKIKEFNNVIESINLKESSSKRITFSPSLSIESFNLALSENPDLISSIQNNESLDQDIISLGKRRKAIKNFEELLSNTDYWKRFRNELSIPDAKEEKVWQKFFENNQWIFGYGLEYKFNALLQREAYLSDQSIGGSESVITDFVLKDSKFISIVELKTPSTPLFNSDKNRSNSWKLSKELIYSYSQVLEQKASAQVKYHQKHNEWDSDGEVIKERAFDPNTYLIIGSWGQISSDSDKDSLIKRKTFELFRRDSRNIEILTYDELFDRAKNIVNYLESDKH